MRSDTLAAAAANPAFILSKSSPVSTFNSSCMLASNSFNIGSSPDNAAFAEAVTPLISLNCFMAVW